MTALEPATSFAHRCMTGTVPAVASAALRVYADPAPDAGVIAEVVTTTANEEIKMSPGVFGWHQDGGNDSVNTVFCKVVNKSGSTGTCTVSLTVVQLEA